MAQDSLLLRDYTFVKQGDPWLTSQNAAALTRFTHQNMTLAECALGGARGGFINYHESDDITQLNMLAESFYRFSPRTVFFGSISYDNFSGRHVAGSAFVSPEHKPFDLVEDSLTNTGTKHRDTYQLTGGVGCQLTNLLAVGAKVDYTATNYAKYKDLRHQNKLMDLQLTAGVYAPLTSWLQLGAYYRYHRNTESIIFGTYGTSDKVYKTLVSYAAFMGQVEQFGSEGYTDKSREMPLVTDYNGVGLQAGLKRQAVSLFATYSYDRGRGYYGRKSPYTITYTEHHSNRHGLQTRLDYNEERTRHELSFNMDYEELENDATTHRELQNTSGATYYEYYTPVKTADKRWLDCGLHYILHLGIQQELPTWTLQADINWTKRRQTAYLFPYYRRQEIHHARGSLSVSRNIVKGDGVWSFTINGSYQKGGGSPSEDLTFQEPSDKQPQPANMVAYLQREYLYLTAAQFSIGGQAKYAFVLPNFGLKPYVRLSVSHLKANECNDYSLGRNRTEAALAIGCTL